jgi:hypothetical protein
MNAAPPTVGTGGDGSSQRVAPSPPAHLTPRQRRQEAKGIAARTAAEGAFYLYRAGPGGLLFRAGSGPRAIGPEFASVCSRHVDTPNFASRRSSRV